MCAWCSGRHAVKECLLLCLASGAVPLLDYEGREYCLLVIALVVATFFAAQKPVAQQMPSAVKPTPKLVEKVEKQEGQSSLERLLDGVHVATHVPLFLKPDFNHGPAASLSLKF